MHGAWKSPRPGPGKFPELRVFPHNRKGRRSAPCFTPKDWTLGFLLFVPKSQRGGSDVLRWRSDELTGSGGIPGTQLSGMVGHTRYEHVRAALLRTPVRTRAVWVDGSFPCLLSFADCVHV